MNFASRALTVKLLFASWCGGGVETFNDLMGRIIQVGGLKREEGMGLAITELESLMLGHQIGKTIR